MDALGCMKSLLLAATQYRAAKTPSNAALLQRSLEVRAAPVLAPPPPRAAVGAGGAAGNLGMAAVSPRASGHGWLFSVPGLGWLLSPIIALGGRSAGSGAAGASAGSSRRFLQAPHGAGRAGPAACPWLSGRRR